MRKKTTLPKGGSFAPRNRPQQEAVIEQLDRLTNLLVEFSKKGNYTSQSLIVLSRQCSLIMRKFFGRNGLISSTFIRKHNIQFNRLKSLENECTITLFSIGSLRGTITITKVGDEYRRPVHPPTTCQAYIRPESIEVTCEFPLLGFTVDHESYRGLLGGMTIFDYSSPMDNVKHWLNQPILSVNSHSISIKDVISAVANFEEAHVHTDESTPSPLERDVVSSITIGGGVTYAHLFIISLSLYIIDHMISLRPNMKPSESVFSFSLPMTKENERLKTPDELLNIEYSYALGFTMTPPLLDEKPIIHKVKIIVPKVRNC